MPYEMFDRTGLKILPLSKRKNLYTLDRIYKLSDPLPEYSHPLLGEVAQHVAEAFLKQKQIIWMQGAHIIRQGNSRYIIDLMERGVIKHFATNGAAAIHDFEFALIGATCESVEENVQDGTFGNWEETGRYMNEAVIRGYKDGLGYGESIGRLIQNEENGIKFPFKDVSVFAAAYRLKIPATVHKSIGYDIIEQHPASDYTIVGGAIGRDFLIYAQSVTKLDGGILFNFGSQVMGPEVFLKSLSMARNVAIQNGKQISNFTVINFDIKNYEDPHTVGRMTDTHYYDRVKKTLLNRTVKGGGESFHISGDFRLTIPNFYHEIIKRIGK